MPIHLVRPYRIYKNMYTHYDDKFNSKRVKKARSKWHRAACKVDYLTQMVHWHRRDKSIIRKLKTDLRIAKEIETTMYEAYVNTKNKVGIYQNG